MGFFLRFFLRIFLGILPSIAAALGTHLTGITIASAAGGKQARNRGIYASGVLRSDA